MKRPPLGRTRRRTLRAIGCAAVAAGAGCLTPSGTDSCSTRADLSLVEATDAHVSNAFSTPLDGLPHAAAPVVSAAIDAGEATARGYYAPEVRSPYVVAGPEADYYRVRTAERDPAEVTGYEYAVEIGIDGSTLREGDPVRSFAELPPRDRESMRSAIGNPGLIHAPHFTSFSVVFAYEDGAARERSAFVPAVDVRYVEWEDALLGVRFQERRRVRITSTTVTADPVAGSPAEFLEHVGRERGVVLEDLTDRQRDVVTRAIEDGYDECEPYSEPFDDLLDRLSTADGFAPLARYDATWYFVDVSGG